MRRSAVLALLAFLAFPGTAAAFAPAPPPDGTLAVKNGNGTVLLDTFRGAVLGRVASGKVIVVNPAGGDCAALLVWGAEAERPVRRIGELRCVYSGSNIRFRLIGDAIDVRALGSGISISAAGTGFVLIVGDGGRDGTYAVNGTDPISLPDEGEGTPFKLVGLVKD